MSEVKKFSNVQDFIEANFPDYGGSQLICDWNDLRMLVDGEHEHEPSDIRTKILNEEYGGDYDKALPKITKDCNELYIEILETAILNM